jgi:hypothetical protein
MAQVVAFAYPVQGPEIQLSVPPQKDKQGNTVVDNKQK